MAPSERVGSGACQCSVPDYRVDKGHVGDWYVQLFACEDCGELVEKKINHLAEIEGLDEPASQFSELMSP